MGSAEQLTALLGILPENLEFYLVNAKPSLCECPALVADGYLSLEWPPVRALISSEPRRWG